MYVIGCNLSLFELDDGSFLTISTLDFSVCQASRPFFFYLKREGNHISSCIHMLFNTENISSSCQEACQCRRGVGPRMMAILSLGNVKTFGKKRWIKMI